MIGEGPQDIFNPAVIRTLIGQNLVDRRSVQVPMCQVGGRVAVELEGDVAAVVNVDLLLVNDFVPVRVDLLPKPPVNDIVLVFNHLVRVTAIVDRVGGKMLHFR